MKLFNLYEFDDKTIEDFTTFSNENWGEPWIVYVESSGGSNWASSHIINLLNLKSSLNSDVILNVSKAYSNGFRLIMDFDGPVNILPHARGMWHQGTCEQPIRLDGKLLSDGDNTNFSKVFRKEGKRDLKIDLELAKRVMNDKELKMYTSGGDVYFTSEQLISFMAKKDLSSTK